MFGLNPYALAAKAGIILAALLLGAWGGHKVTSDAWKASERDMLAVQASQRAADETRLNELSAQLETAKAKRDVVYKTITKKVDRIVTVYADRACLDPDGVSALNAAIVGQSSDPGGPSGVVRPSGAGG